MARTTLTAKKTAATEENLVPQMFKVPTTTYRMVRLLAATRRGTGKPATGQDIYNRAVEEYLERNAKELQAASAAE